MEKDAMKGFLDFIRSNREEVASVLGNIEWLELTLGRIVVDEKTLNQDYIPLFKNHLPKEVEDVEIRIRKGYLEITTQVFAKGKQIKGDYKIWIDDMVFNQDEHRLVLSYEEDFPLDGVSLGERLLMATGKLLVQTITGHSVIGYLLKDVPGLSFHDHQMTIKLDQMPAFQELKEKKLFGYSLLERMKIKEILMEDKRMTVNFSIIGWDEAAVATQLEEDELQQWKLSGEEEAGQDIVVMEKKHQRFYDKLRQKIERFLHEKGGSAAIKNGKYLLLVPDFFVLIARLIRDKRVPLKSKTLLGAVLAYFISPIDIIPEAITGPIGFMDDLVLATFALKSILLEVDERVVKQHWNGEQSLLDVIQDIIKKADDLVGSKALNLIKKTLNNK